MKKFLIGLVCGLLLAGMAAFVIVFALARLGDRRPPVAAGSTLVLRLEGEIPERNPVDFPIPWLQSQTPQTVLELRGVLHRAADDERIKALLFEPRGVAAGWGKVHEVRDALLRFKKSGKPIIAYLRWPKSREYYLATAADRIYLAREDLFDLKGIRAELTFLRTGLDKLGVEFEIEHAGKYKDAADTFTRTSASPETREVVNSMLDGIYGHLISTIATARKFTPDQARALLDEGPYLATQAKEKRLVDDLLFEDQVDAEIKTRLGQTELNKISQHDYLRANRGGRGRTRIAVIVGEGEILRGGAPGAFQEESLYSTPFVRLLRDVASDTSIRGVILRINSPGGDAVASDDILREVRLLSRKKPLVVSMSDLAASGGYFIAMSGDPIVAYPNTITGSIGVIYGKVNLAGLYTKLGVGKEILQRGRFAAIDSEAVPLDEAGRRKLREGLESVYSGFLQRVAEGRKRKVAEIEPLAEGRVWLGSQAKSNGLIDEVGGIDRAIELVRERAKIGASEQVSLVVYPRKKTIFEQLFESSGQSLVEATMETKREAALSQLARLLGIDAGNLRLWIPGGYLRIAPYSVRFE